MPRRKLLVKRSQIPKGGKGLFTLSEIPKGEKIVEYKGRLERWRDVKDEDGYNAYIFKINNRWAINALPYKTALGRFANDARGIGRVPGLRNNAEYDTEGKHCFIFSTRKIKAGEEIFVDYGRGFWRLIDKIEKIKKKAKKRGHQ